MAQVPIAALVPREFTAGAPPMTGTYRQGDRIWSSTPVSGQPVGWVCVSSGSPGTWCSFGVVA